MNVLRRRRESSLGGGAARVGMSMSRLLVSVAFAALLQAVSAGVAWTDISEAVAASEAASAPSGTAVCSYSVSGPFVVGDAGQSSAEVVADGRTFDSLSWFEFLFPLSRFFSTPQMGSYLIFR